VSSRPTANPYKIDYDKTTGPANKDRHEHMTDRKTDRGTE